MTLQDDCRRWAAEMHRVASALAEAGVPVEMIDGNRTIADTLTRAADRIDELERRTERAEHYIKECLDPKGED